MASMCYFRLSMAIHRRNSSSYIAPRWSLRPPCDWILQSFVGSGLRTLFVDIHDVYAFLSLSDSSICKAICCAFRYMASKQLSGQGSGLRRGGTFFDPLPWPI